MSNEESFKNTFRGRIYFVDKKGKFHRIDGPAITQNGKINDPDDKWFFHGKKIQVSSQSEFERWLKLKVFV